ncbi:MOSC domain-containing protein YiiM [Maribacter vaceletii]|uniref:MOSC domain-containing protein YiiM n=1 Tax=Maribacter vaceletii TaxID=1206816 RepID=A0A495DS59_9FLAO|nr:MOSC domain-containing protein [Maribacter vaceletii]RKR06523.1 MOSC domain-containing protein YiiM [Maribacter vaceletii]
MKVIATNISKPTTIVWNGKEEQTGIYKYPVNEPIFLGKYDVAKDTVIDRKHHGGIHKACYLFSADNYEYWKNLYPNLDWNWGMFGENLTVEGLDEATLKIGNIYKVGECKVQITQPREPCYKLGIKFGSQNILKQFINHQSPGTYIKILEEGYVKAEDTFVLIEESDNSLTIQQFYNLLYAKVKDKEIIKTAISNPTLPEYKKEKLKKYL